MSKSLYELLIMIESSREMYDRSITVTGNERIHLLELTNATYELISQLSDIISPNISSIYSGDIDSFYSDMENFITGSHYSIPEDKKDELLAISREAEVIDEQIGSDEVVREYDNLKSNPLYIRIMGQNAMKQISDLEKIAGGNTRFSLESAGYDEEEINESYDKWNEILSSKLKSGSLNEREYDYYSRQLGYLKDYYVSTRKGEQEKYNNVSRVSLSLEDHQKEQTQTSFASNSSLPNSPQNNEDKFWDELSARYNLDEFPETVRERFMRSYMGEQEPVEEVEPVERHRVR